MQTCRTKQNRKSIEAIVTDFLESSGEIRNYAASVPHLCRYFEELSLWNRKINLTGSKSLEHMVCKHLGDTLVLARWLPDWISSILDIGSGAGIPGLILKILRPDIDIWLLDARRKRVSFLNAVIAQLGLHGVHAVHGRAGTGVGIRASGVPESFDMVTGQAVGSIVDLAVMAAEFIKPGAMAVAMKGPEGKNELESALLWLNEHGWEAKAVPAETPVKRHPRFLVVMHRQ